MKTRDALRQMTGRHTDYGDGPLGEVAAQLLEGFDQREAHRMATAEERAARNQAGPLLTVLEREVRQARAARLFDNSLPMVSRFEAHQAMQRAKADHASDKGVRQAAAHVQRLWQQDMTGHLAVGDIARLRAHYSGQFPKSRVAHVIDVEIPRVGFNTLPVHRLASMAAQVSGATEEERQYAYEQVVRANGLDGRKPEHKRARAFIRSLAEMAAEREAPQYGAQGGQGVMDRTLNRMAAYDDPILSRMGQAAGPPPMEDPMGMDPMMDEAPLPEIEEEIPHDESSEVIEEVMSPNTGEPMVLELGPSEEVPLGEDELGMEMAPPTSATDVSPAFIASLQYFGQLDDYATEGDPMDIDMAPEAEDIPMDEELAGGEETSVLMPDPTSEGEEIEVILRPAGTEDELLPGEGEALPPPAIGLDEENPLGARAGSRRQVFAVFAVRGGTIHSQPLEVLRAPSMPAVLKRIAKKLRDADGGHAIRRSVLGRSHDFRRFALVELDASVGNFLQVVAQEHGSEFTPDIVTNGQPVVRHNVNVPDDGDQALMSDSEHSQNKPSALGDETAPTHESHSVSAKALTKKQIRQVCAQMGLTAKDVEARVLDGETVQVRDASLRLTDSMDVEFKRGRRGRTASLMDLNRVISDFMAYAAVVATRSPAPGRQAKVTKLAFDIRPLFTVGCQQCGGVDEYLMPETPQNVRCARCTYVTPAQAIAIQLGARQANAFPGYVITTDIPGKPQDRQLNAKRVLREIGRVAHVEDQPVIESGRLRVAVRNLNEAGLNRIRLVLEDKFGVHNAVMQPRVALGDTTPFGTNTQHAMTPGAPPQVPAPGMPPQQPTAPPDAPMTSAPIGVAQPGPTTPGGGAAIGAVAQGAAMDAARDPLRAASRLPVARGLKHVQIREPDGAINWLPIEAATDEIARTMVATFMDGTEVLQVIDSQQHVAQMEMAAEPPPMGGEGLEVGGDMPAEQLGLESGGMDIMEAGDSQIDETLKEAANSAFKYYRFNEKLPIATAIDRFMNTAAGKSLTRYGEEPSPQRQLAEAAVVRIAKEWYEKPGMGFMDMTEPPAGFSPFGQRQRQAADPKGPSPRKINTQQDDWVNLPGGGEVLGPDSETVPSTTNSVEAPKINTQVDPMNQPGASGADTSTQPDTETRDPKRFDAPKPEATGHTFTGPGGGWGTSYTDKNLGKDSDTGESQGGTTNMMSSESSGAYGNIRSK